MAKNIRAVNKKKRKLLLLSMLIICLALTACFKIKQPEKPQESIPLTPAQTKYAAENAKSWYLTLVNKWNPITSNKVIELIELSNKESIDKRVYPYLQEMFDAARKDGLAPIVTSGYRTRQQQQKIYDDKFNSYKAQGFSNAKAKKETELWVGIPDASEHQLGLAADINDSNPYSSDTRIYDWLKNNAYLYGFIERYPANKTKITGVEAEPWHYRYVGRQAAAEMFNQKICLEEYLQKTN